MISEKNPNFFSREDTVVPRGYAGELLESRCRCTGVPRGVNIAAQKTLGEFPRVNIDFIYYIPRSSRLIGL